MIFGYLSKKDSEKLLNQIDILNTLYREKINENYHLRKKISDLNKKINDLIYEAAYNKCVKEYEDKALSEIRKLKGDEK